MTTTPEPMSDEERARREADLVDAGLTPAEAEFAVAYAAGELDTENTDY